MRTLTLGLHGDMSGEVAWRDAKTKALAGQELFAHCGFKGLGILSVTYVLYIHLYNMENITHMAKDTHELERRLVLLITEDEWRMFKSFASANGLATNEWMRFALRNSVPKNFIANLPKVPKAALNA